VVAAPEIASVESGGFAARAVWRVGWEMIALLVECGIADGGRRFVAGEIGIAAEGGRSVVVEIGTAEPAAVIATVGCGGSEIAALLAEYGIAGGNGFVVVRGYIGIAAVGSTFVVIGDIDIAVALGGGNTGVLVVAGFVLLSRNAHR
jgi:hypothetical protein